MYVIPSAYLRHIRHVKQPKGKNIELPINRPTFNTRIIPENLIKI
jgi:hypothetical protein